MIDGNDKWIQRCHLEECYIKLMKSAMNRDEGFLPSDYDYLIRMVRNRQGSSNSHCYQMFTFCSLCITSRTVQRNVEMMCFSFDSI